MKQYLVDSDILIDFFKRRAYSVSLLSKLRQQGTLAVSILSIAELRAGWDDTEANYLLPRLYKLLKIKNLDYTIAELAGKFRWEFRAKGISLPTIDSLIAATAINENCQLVTRNKKDFPMPEIKFYPVED